MHKSGTKCLTLEAEAPDRHWVGNPAFFESRFITYNTRPDTETRQKSVVAGEVAIDFGRPPRVHGGARDSCVKADNFIWLQCNRTPLCTHKLATSD